MVDWALFDAKSFGFVHCSLKHVLQLVPTLVVV